LTVRVLFTSFRFDYGEPARGDSFEYENLWDALRRMPGIEARFFGFDEHTAALGAKGMNAELLRVADEWRPDLAFFFLFRDEIFPETLAGLRQIDGVTTLNWFADDHWRFSEFSRDWAPRFDWVVTTDARAVARYRRIGVEHAIHSQWGCNHHVYRATGEPRDIDVSFVGQPYGHRRELVEALRNTGIAVETWGHGWERGRIAQKELVEILSRSKISLNFAASSRHHALRYVAAQFLRRRGPLVVPRFGELTANAMLMRDAYRPQLKARNFEIAASGALLMTEYVDQLETYYRVGREAVAFKGERDLVRKVRRYLQRDDERDEIARAGTERTLREHTYERRFEAVFARIGQSRPPR
jgi:spore maturation protein CgeB